MNEEDVFEAAINIYNELQAAGIEVILDDRDERAGVKFKDADLIGVPVQLVVSERNLKENQIEAKVRRTGDRAKIALGDFTKDFRSVISSVLGVKIL